MFDFIKDCHGGKPPLGDVRGVDTQTHPTRSRFVILRQNLFCREDLFPCLPPRGKGNHLWWMRGLKHYTYHPSSEAIASPSPKAKRGKAYFVILQSSIYAISEGKTSLILTFYLLLFLRYSNISPSLSKSSLV